MPTLTVDRLSKRYGTRTVLKEVSFTLRPGQLTVLSGRSGSGKSTLMNILAGLDTPTSGEVRLGELSYTDMDETTRTWYRLHQVGIVFQSFQLIADLTAEENVRLPLKLAGAKNAKEKAERLLKELGLGQHLSAFPETLSGGEMQRVAIARALANDPKIVLADEPTANLDDDNARTVLRMLREVATEDRLVLVATHDPLALGYADRRLAIHSGHVGEERPAMAKTGETVRVRVP
ncbi:MAG: ABC transporter ATP-binding protein [Euryarchaeota archaeon]|nr:ABC transporter ATP-binding protein [Euryarchaeota archaeon]